MSSTSKDAVTLRAKRSKKPSDGKMRRNVEIFVLSAPAILLFVCFVILPIVLGAYYGFYQWKGYGIPSKTGKFVGFQNYITALKRRFCIPSRSWSARWSSRLRSPSCSHCC